MKVRFAWLLLMVLLLSGGCKKYSDDEGSYRISTDKTMRIYYLESKIAFIFFEQINSGKIATAYGVGSPDLKASTGDQIQNILVDHIQSLNQDAPSGVVYGELHGIHEAENFFLFNGKDVVYFPTEETLKEKLPESLRTGKLVFYPAKDFMDELKKNSKKL